MPKVGLEAARPVKRNGSRVRGAADPSPGRPVAGDTLFAPFSGTKAITATLLHIQAARGLMAPATDDCMAIHELHARCGTLSTRAIPPMRPGRAGGRDMRGVVWDGVRLVVTDELEIRDPGPGEVQVRVLASGICHSDVNVIERGGNQPAPQVLGHEGAGVVERVGSGVVGVKPGDAVAVTCQVPCQKCRACGRGNFTQCPTVFAREPEPFRWRGRTVGGFANSSSFAGLVNVVPLQLQSADGISPFAAALVGCAVSTGFGSAKNVARVTEGDNVAVFGVGGIGINAIQTSKVLGAARIVAVDVNPAKEAVSLRFGAHGFVLAPRDADAAAVAALVRDEMGTDVDAAIEASGAPVAVDASIACLGRGGRAALIGIPPEGTRPSFDIHALQRSGQAIVGSLNGSTDPYRDMPEIMQLVRAGRIELEAQVGKVFPLGQVDDAIAAMRTGDHIRVVLDHTR